MSVTKRNLRLPAVAQGAAAAAPELYHLRLINRSVNEVKINN